MLMRINNYQDLVILSTVWRMSPSKRAPIGCEILDWQKGLDYITVRISDWLAEYTGGRSYTARGQDYRHVRLDN